MNRSVQDVLFTLIWSLVLFISTFPKVVLDFDVNHLFENGELSKTVLMPMILVLALYLWEEMFNIHNTNNLIVDKMKCTVIKTFGGIAASIICIGLAYYYRCFILLALAWFSISYIKYVSLQIMDSSITLDKV